MTGGTLPAAYAEFAVDRDTHEVVIRIRDAATDRVLNEYPSRAVQEMHKHLQDYANVARRRASLRPQSAN